MVAEVSLVVTVSLQDMADIDAFFNDSDVYLKSKESWHIKAWHLMGAAGALWACKNEQRSTELVKELGLATEFSMEHALWRPYLMLCGMALEVLFKAIVVAKGGTPDTSSHELPELARLAGVPLTSKQKGLLEVLTAYIGLVVIQFRRLQNTMFWV